MQRKQSSLYKYQDTEQVSAGFPAAILRREVGIKRWEVIKQLLELAE